MRKLFIKDSIEYLTNKLIRRHPHVFGDVTVKDSSDVLKNWEAIKKQEREKKKTDSSCLAGIPRGMPALLRSYRMQEKAAKKDFGKKTKSVYYSNYQPDYLYVTLEREWVEKTTYAPFEDTEYQVPIHSHEILTWVYGDYMKIPDEKDRKAGHGTKEMEFNVIEV